MLPRNLSRSALVGATRDRKRGDLPGVAANFAPVVRTVLSELPALVVDTLHPVDGGHPKKPTSLCRDVDAS